MLRNATNLHIPTHSPPLRGLELNHDLFRIKAIGKNGRLILTGLDFKEWRSISELVVLTNLRQIARYDKPTRAYCDPES